MKSRNDRRFTDTSPVGIDDEVYEHEMIVD